MKKMKKIKSRPAAPTPGTGSHRSELPIDIISFILVRLPVKTLSRFRCVCKPWHSLISSPHFQHHHYLRSQQNPLLHLTRKGRYNELHFLTYTSVETTLLNKFSLSIPDYWELQPILIQSCRGLVCLLSGSGILPSTEEIIALLPWAPYTDLCLVGFGFAAEGFKVVGFFYDYDDYCWRCQVFTLGTQQWREARSPPPFDEGWQGAPLLHGSLHLLSSEYIAAFDLESEEYKEIQLPEYRRRRPAVDFDELEYTNLTELGGSLCLTIGVRQKLELWLLKDYHNGEWMKQYTIDPCKLGGKILDSIDSRYVYGILGDGKLLVNLDGPHGANELVCYDPKNQSVTMRMGGVCSAALYVESFFSLGSR